MSESNEHALAPVPVPQLLDPERLVLPERGDFTADEHASRLAAVRDALRASCEYGVQLRDTLQAVREYLVDSLPTDAAQPGAAPTGVRDDDGWAAWQAIYAGVTSALAGVHGDSGFGAEEAQVIAQHRRGHGSQ